MPNIDTDNTLNSWSCTIGECNTKSLPKGSDWPMRQAVAETYFKLCGEEPKFIFSGWGRAFIAVCHGWPFRRN